MRRLAFVTDAVYPFHMGGKEKRLHEISRRLVKPGQQVHVYTMKWWDGPNVIQREGVYFHAICRRYPLYNGTRRSMMEAIMFGLAVWRLLFARFDVMDVDSMPFFPVFSARAVCWLRFRRLHATWHEVTDLAAWREYLGHAMGTIAYAIETAASRLPDTIISNSEQTTLRLRLAGVKQRVLTVPLGVNINDIYAVPTSPQKSDVIYVGRLLAHKNVDVLIRAIALAVHAKPDLSLTIVGNGPEKRRLTALTAQLGLGKHIRFTGFIDEATDLYAVMKASKVFVLPSTREGFGLVAVEANAAGLPVITTSHPDNAARDLITEGVNGYLADLTPADLSDKILKALGNRSRLQPDRRVEEYDWQNVALKVERALGV